MSDDPYDVYKRERHRAYMREYRSRSKARAIKAAKARWKHKRKPGTRPPPSPATLRNLKPPPYLRNLEEEKDE